MNEQQGLDPMFQENGSQWMEGGLASEPLNVYTAKTFGWMFLGLLVTFGTAIAFSAGGGLYYLLTMGMPAVFALAIAEIVVVMVLSARLHKLSIGAARGLFFAYAVLNGITFSAVFFAYDVQILLTVFALTSLYFGVLAAYGWFTKRDLSGLSYPDGRADLPFGILAHLHVPAALRVRPHHLLCRLGRVHGPDGI